MSIFVVKFGGSTLGKEPEVMDNLAHIADIIRQYSAHKHKIAVVVSAFAGETRRLRENYQSLGITADTPEADYILAMGEQKSSVVVANYLNNKAGIKATAMVGPKLPIVTDGAYGNARVTDVKAAAIREVLNNGRVAIIPGFIGYTPEGMTATLGLDGSDTTAAFVAGYLGVKECRLYKDVAGVFTANPRRVPLARKIEAIGTAHMMVFSELGARILHPRALEAAAKYDMMIRVLPNFADAQGTVISKKVAPKAADTIGVTYWQHNKDVITVSLVGKATAAEVIKELGRGDIEATLFPTEHDGASVTALLKNPDDLNRALQRLHSFAGLDDEESLKMASSHFFDPGLIQL
jgi:aspartate kinase